MTRIEEIMQQAELTVFPWDDVREQVKFEDGFIEGAKWADKTMIDKACEWLKKCFYEQEHECDYGYYITLETTFDELNDIIDDFRKAMEE